MLSHALNEARKCRDENADSQEPTILSKCFTNLSIIGNPVHQVAQYLDVNSRSNLNNTCSRASKIVQYHIDSALFYHPTDIVSVESTDNVVCNPMTGDTPQTTSSKRKCAQMVQTCKRRLIISSKNVRRLKIRNADDIELVLNHKDTFRYVTHLSFVIPHATTSPYEKLKELLAIIPLLSWVRFKHAGTQIPPDYLSLIRTRKVKMRMYSQRTEENYDFITAGSLTIVVDERSTQPFVNALSSSMFAYIDLGFGFKGPFEALPKTLTHLTIRSWHFDTDLPEIPLLTHLVLPFTYNRRLSVGGKLPNLEYLCVGTDYNDGYIQSLNPNRVVKVDSDGTLVYDSALALSTTSAIVGRHHQ